MNSFFFSILNIYTFQSCTNPSNKFQVDSFVYKLLVNMKATSYNNSLVIVNFSFYFFFG